MGAHIWKTCFLFPLPSPLGRGPMQVPGLVEQMKASSSVQAPRSDSEDGWLRLQAWGDTASHVQAVAIRKFKSMTAQGQSPCKVTIFQHPFQALHLLPIIHQESKQHRFLENDHRRTPGISQELHQGGH